MSRQGKTESIKSADTPDSTDSQIAKVPHEAVAANSLPGNRSINHLKTKRIMSRKPRIFSENKTMEQKEHTLDTNVETSTEQRRGCRTTSEQTVNVISPNSVAWSSKSFPGHDVHESPSLVNHIDTHNKENASEYSSHNPPLETTPNEKTSDNLICTHLIAPLEQMQELDSLQANVKCVPDKVTKTNDPASFAGRNLHPHKYNNKCMRALKSATVSTNLASTSSRSTHDAPSGDKTRSESSSISRCRSSYLYPVRQKKQDNLPEPSLKNSGEESATMNCHEQFQNSESRAHQTSDLSLSSTDKEFQSKLNIQRAELGYVMATVKENLNKTSKGHCQTLLQTPNRDIVDPALPSTGDIPTKSSRKLLLQNDVKTLESQRIQPLTATQNRFKRNKLSTIDKGKEIRTETIRKLNTENKPELASNLYNSVNNPLTTSQSVPSKENKPDELMKPDDKAKESTYNRLKNRKLGSSVGPRPTKTSNRRMFNSLKLIGSKGIAKIDTYDKLRLITPTTRSALSKYSIGDRREDTNETTEHLCAKMHNNNLALVKQEIVQVVSSEQKKPVSSGLALVVDQCTISRSIESFNIPYNQNETNISVNDDSEQLNIHPSISLSTGSKDFQRRVSPFCKHKSQHSCNERGLVHVYDISQMSANIKQEDLVPVICFHWRKREDALLQEEGSPAQNGRQRIVSLDQGLNVIKQIITDVASKNEFCNTEYIFSQCNNAESQCTTSCPSSENKHQSRLVSDIYFRLTPKTNVHSSQASLPNKHTQIPKNKGKGKKVNNSFQQNQNRTESDQFIREVSTCPFQRKTNALKRAFQAQETSLECRLETDSTVNGSQFSNEHKTVSSTWYSVSRKIVAFFLNSRFKDRIYSFHTVANILENNASERDEQISSDETSQDVDDFVAQQERITYSLRPSHNLKPPIIAFLGYLLQGRYDSSNSSEKQVTKSATTSTADVSSWRGHEVARQQVNTTVNADVNENRSRLQEVFNVLLWKISGENRVFSCRKLHNKMVGDTEITGKHGPVSAAVNVSLKQGITDDQGNHQSLDYSQNDCKKVYCLDDDLKKTIINTHQDINADHKNGSTCMSSSTLYVNNLSSELNKRNLVTDTSMNLEESSINEDLDVSCNWHSNVAVDEICQMNYQSMCTDEHLSSTCTIYPDPSLEFSYNNDAWLLTAKLSGFGAAVYKHHPHLVWIMRSRALQKECDWIKSGHRPRIYMSKSEPEIADQSKQTQLNERVNSINTREDCAESIQNKVGHNNDISSVKRNIAKIVRRYLNTLSFRHNICSKKPTTDDMDKHVKQSKKVHELSCKAVTSLRNSEQPQSSMGDEREIIQPALADVPSFICIEGGTGLIEGGRSACYSDKRISPKENSVNDNHQNGAKVNKRCVAKTQIETPCIPQSHINIPCFPQSQINTPCIPQSQIDTSYIKESQTGTTCIQQSHTDTLCTPQSQNDTLCTEHLQINAPYIQQSCIDTPYIPQSQIDTLCIPQSHMEIPCIPQKQIETTFV